MIYSSNMASLHIKHFGPIEDSTRIEFTPLMVLIGRQSSGKSTFMKVLCFCRWIEKRVMVSTDDIINQYTHYGRFVKELKQFHRLNDDYFKKNTSIEYEGDTITIEYRGGTNPKISRKSDFAQRRYNSKICYIPAERNLVSALQNIDRAYKATERDVLFNFIYEWDEAKSPSTKSNPYRLSVTGGFSYANKSGNDFIIRKDGTESPAFYASSGIQSVTPLDVMSHYMMSQVGKRAPMSMSDLNAIQEPNSKRLTYQSAQVFIEEPEQNLYPESQRLIILSLVKALAEAQKKESEPSMIMLTTHSPYILSVINVLLSASAASSKEAGKGIIDSTLLLNPSDVSGYFINEDGIFKSIVDDDLQMLDGMQLDGVSDWVEEKISQCNKVLYGDE